MTGKLQERLYTAGEILAAFDHAAGVAKDCTNLFRAFHLLDGVKATRGTVLAHLGIERPEDGGGICDAEAGSAQRQAQNREREGGTGDGCE